MEEPVSLPGARRTCPSCQSPVEAAHQFCENCGTKMEELPVCKKCGARFLAPVKFCELCGTPVIAAEKTQVIKKTTISPEPKKEIEPEPDTDAAVECNPEPVAKTVSRTPDPLAVFSDSEPPKDPPQEKEPANAPETVKPPLNRNLIIGAVLLLLVIGAVIYIMILPMTGGSDALSPGVQPQPQTSTPAQVPSTLPTAVITTVPTTAPPPPDNPLLPKPTEAMPESQMVLFQIQKDPVTATITVIFAGGPGTNSISSGDVTVTSDDGTVQTGTIRPSQGETELVLKGTKGRDRVEVIARMFSGQTYRVYDEIMSYTARS